MRATGLAVVAQYGTTAIEALATPDEAATLSGLGLLRESMLKFCGPKRLCSRREPKTKTGLLLCVKISLN